jgi:hypothetical protein
MESSRCFGREPQEETPVTCIWYEVYKNAILETDWTKRLQRILSAASEIQQRLPVLHMDHGGTTKERQAIAQALVGMKLLLREADESKNRKNTLPDSQALLR